MYEGDPSYPWNWSDDEESLCDTCRLRETCKESTYGSDRFVVLECDEQEEL